MTETASKYAFCTLNDVRADLKIGDTDTSFDEQLRRLVNGVSRAIENYCGRVFAARDVAAKKYDGDDTDVLLLNTCPIISVSTLLVETLTIPAASYVLYNEIGKIVLIDGTIFTAGPQTVSVSYRAGYERQDFPDDVGMAARIWVCHLFKIAKDQRYGVGSQTVTEESFSFAPGSMPPEVKEILEMHRLWR